MAVETEEEVFRKYLGNKICKEKWLYLDEREETNESDSNDLAKLFGSGSIEWNKESWGKDPEERVNQFSFI